MHVFLAHLKDWFAAAVRERTVVCNKAEANCADLILQNCVTVLAATKSLLHAFYSNALCLARK